jgi:diguanylate cyclase (GGDEF)-like protein
MKSVVSRQWGYPVLGLVLALSTSLGLVVTEAFARGRMPTPSFMQEQIAAQPVVYAYTSVTLIGLLTFLGWLLGRREDRLQAGSLTDPLTGLWNRRLLANRLQEELARALRHRTPLAFMLVDVDRLKQLNDRGGHQGGDDALRHVAEAIRRSCRRSDIPARYGGDEFAVLAPSTAGSDAVALAERIRSAVREQPAGELTLSVSIGVADLEDLDGASLEQPDELCQAADRALYSAKQRGRDRVVRASDLAPAQFEQATT